MTEEEKLFNLERAGELLATLKPWLRSAIESKHTLEAVSLEWR